MNNSYTLEEAKKKLEHYCAYQERCHKEVTQKLIQMQMIPEVRDHIVVHLLEHNFLNEERYAKAFVSGKFNIKKWGKQRLKLELKRKDISSYNISAALKTIDEQTYERLFPNVLEGKNLTSSNSIETQTLPKLLEENSLNYLTKAIFYTHNIKG